MAANEDGVATSVAACGTVLSSEDEPLGATPLAAVASEADAAKPNELDELEIINPRSKRPLAPYSQRELYEKKSPPPVPQRHTAARKAKRASNGTGGGDNSVQHARAFTPPGPNIHDPCTHRYVAPGAGGFGSPAASPRPPNQGHATPATGPRKKAASGRDALRMSREAPLRSSRDVPLRSSREAPLRASREQPLARAHGSPGPSYASPRPNSQRSPRTPTPPPPLPQPPPQRTPRDSQGSAVAGSAKVPQLQAPEAASTTSGSAVDAVPPAAAGRSPAVGRSKSAGLKRAQAGAAAVQAQVQPLPAKARSSPHAAGLTRSWVTGKGQSARAMAVPSAPAPVGKRSSKALRGAPGAATVQAQAVPTTEDGAGVDGTPSSHCCAALGAERNSGGAAMLGAEAVDVEAVAVVAAAEDDAAPPPPANAATAEAQPEGDLGLSGAAEEEGHAEETARSSAQLAAGSHAATDGIITDSEACAEDAGSTGGVGEKKGQDGVGGGADGATAAESVAAGGGASKAASGKLAGGFATAEAGLGGGKLEVEEGPTNAGCRCVVM